MFGVQVKTWFQNRRAKWRRLKQDGQEGEKEAENAEQGKNAAKKTKHDGTSEEDNGSADDEDSSAYDDAEKKVRKDPEVKVEVFDQGEFGGLKGGTNGGGFPVERGEDYASPPGVSSSMQDHSHASISYHRLPNIGPLSQPYYPNQIPPQPYHNNNNSYDYQSPVLPAIGPTNYTSQPLQQYDNFTSHNAQQVSLHSAPPTTTPLPPHTSPQ